MLSSILSNQPYANEPVYILEPQWHRSWMADDITAARAVRGRSWDIHHSATTHHHHRITGIAWSADPCRWRHRLDFDIGSHVTRRRWPVVRWLRRLRGIDQSSHVGHGLVTRTLGNTASWSWSSSSDDNNYRGVVDDCSDAVVHHVRRAMNTCCRARVANEVRACFGVLMREAMEPAFLDDIVNVVDNTAM